MAHQEKTKSMKREWAGAWTVFLMGLLVWIATRSPETIQAYTAILMILIPTVIGAGGVAFVGHAWLEYQERLSNMTPKTGSDEELPP